MNRQRNPIVVVMALVLSLLSTSVVSPAASRRGDSVFGALLTMNSTQPALAMQQKKTIKLTIVVVDSSQKPVAGARVEITHDALGPEFRAADYQLETDAKGIASTDVVIGKKLGEGSLYWPVVHIEVSKDLSKGLGRVKFVGPNYRPEETCNIVMHAIDATGRELIKVQVHVERENGQPAEGATVLISGSSPSERYQGITGAKGDATIFVPTDIKRTYGIVATKQGYKSANAIIELHDKQVEKVVTAPSLTITKIPGVEVTVRVKDQDDNRGVADAVVILDGDGSNYHRETTDSSGNVTLVLSERGRYAVRISQALYEPLKESEVLLEGETNALEFSLKAKPKKSAGSNFIEVTVLQGDRVEKIARYNLPLPEARVIVGQYIDSTDRSGKVTVAGDFEGNVEVAVEASGYKRQVKSVRISDKQRYTGGTASLTFLMHPEASEDSIEVSVFTAGKNNEGSVPLAGAAVSAGEETATTNANGRAKLTGSFEDSVEVAVEKGGYLRQTKSINASGGKGSASFTLQPEPDEDSVTVTVMGQDPKGGSPAPIAGALVTANGLTETTNKSGQATITGNFKSGVDVDAKAKGFISQAQQVSIALPARTGVANFTLVPEPAPLRLIVEVRDSAKPNNLLAGATVHVREPGKPVEGSAPILSGKTNSQGEASFEIKSADDLVKIGSGLKLEVMKDKYLVKLSEITKDLLLPAAEPRRWTVFLSSDWSDLRAAVDALEPKVFAWNNDRALAEQGSNLVQKLVEQSAQAKQKVTTLMQGIEDASVIARGAMVPLPVNHFCTQAARLRSNIEGYKTEAQAKEQALKTQLDNASALSASCSSVKDVEGVRGMYRSAIQLAAAIGALDNKAMNDGKLLNELTGQRKHAEKIIEEVEKNVAEIRQEASKAETAARAAEAYFVRADNLSKSLYARHASLSGELASLRARYGLNNFVEGLPTDLNKRVEVMTQLVGKQNVFGEPNLDGPKQVQDVSADISAAVQRADAFLARYKSIAGSCEIQTIDDLAQEIKDSSFSARTELAAASDLANKCTESAKRGACAPVVAEVRNLMQQGSIQAALAKVGEARAGGCDVTGLDEEIDYYKTLYEAVAMLKAAQNNCRFQEALDFVHRMPAGVQEKPLIRQALTDVQAGLNALMATRNLLERARQAGVAQNIAEQDRFLANAQSSALNYACLTEEVNNFKRTKRINRGGGVLGAPVNKPEVEEIPDEAINRAREAGDILAKAGKGVDQPEIEEIPETSVKRSQPIGNIKRRGHQRTAEPEVEEIPETPLKRTAAGNTNRRGNRRTAQPEIEEIPEVVRPHEPSEERQSPRDTSPRQAAGERWTLVSITANPKTPQVTGSSKWAYSEQSSSAHFELYNGDQADFQWTKPPQQIDSNGFTVSLNVQAQPKGKGRVAAIIGVTGTGLTTATPRDQQAVQVIGEEGSSGNGQRAVKFKPIPGASEIKVDISFMWAIKFTYLYQRAQ